MKRVYLKLRTVLITFAFGLAGVFAFNGSLKPSNEMPVNLPKIQSESPIVIFPSEEKYIPYCGGSLGQKEENSKTCHPSVS